MEPHPDTLGHGCLLLRTLAAAAFAFAGVVASAQEPKDVNSPEVLTSGRVIFRLLAPGATSVSVKGLRDLAAQAMAKDSSGLWSVTVGPLPPDIYSYQFVVDGATVTDPNNRDVKKYFVSESQFEVPGRPPILVSAQRVPHGTLHHQVYLSKVRRADAGVWIYTPAGYDPRASLLYPAVYLLHGLGDREEAWIEAGHANTIADNLIAQRKISPVILVMPYGNPIPLPGKRYVKGYYARNTPAMQADLLGQLIPLIEKDYRVDPNASKRAIAGLSMGGGQALMIGLSNPTVFKWVGALQLGGAGSRLRHRVRGCGPGQRGPSDPPLDQHRQKGRVAPRPERGDPCLA